ncbi:AAA family ATPase [Peribacillus acanthi]|uniref:AAA family ATPase n=1 Tax=Peribacillus acanthi TaxID=2171554 RepID=UPI000D3E1343|nr:AAA family ATPase [Peribacillus acanthi]
MISKIKKLQNFGIYQDFSHTIELNEFNRFNLFYGWNGSGKSTLSRLFRILDKREVPTALTDSYFEIEFKDGQLLTPDNLPDFLDSIVVFNQDFIQDNIDWNQTVESILLVSEEKIEERKELNDKYQRQKDILNDMKKINRRKKLIVEQNQKTLSRIAKEIKSNFKFLATNDNYYINYNKNKLEQLIITNKSILLEKSAILDDPTLELVTKAAKPEVKEGIDNYIPEIDFTKLEKVISEISNLLQEKIVSKTIRLLQENYRLSLWVEEGLELHHQKKATTCEFCGNEIGKQRLKDLDNHFNTSFKNLKSSLSTQLQTIESLYVNANTFPSPEIFYEELQTEYLHNKKEYVLAISELNSYLLECKQQLMNKNNSPFEDFSIPIYLNTDKKNQLKTISSNINKLISIHNIKTKDFKTKIKSEQHKLELHYATEALQDFDYFIKLQEIADYEKEVTGLVSEDRHVQNRITELESSLISAALGADKFNQKLSQFLGHQEISLEFNQKEKGYNIIRNINGNKIKARNLSEGEKTAIAFIYFITKLKENDKNINESIIVIDDPISSFDAKNLFNSYSYLRDECTHAKQLFVLTHNFAFYRLVRDWMKGKTKKRQDNGRQLKIPLYSFYTIETNFDNQRNSSIVNAHSSLFEYETEYHYIFYKLSLFKEKTQLNIEEAYLVANLSRKLLESFLSFKHPKKRTDFRQLAALAFDDETILEKVYRFINKYSHHQYFDFQDYSSDNLLGESQNIITDIFNAIRKKDTDHFNEMETIIAHDLIST